MRQVGKHRYTIKAKGNLSELLPPTYWGLFVFHAILNKWTLSSFEMRKAYRAEIRNPPAPDRESRP